MGYSKFWKMVDQVPYAQHLFDIDHKEMNCEKLKRFLGTASHGEAVMTRFLAGVWFGNNEHIL